MPAEPSDEQLMSAYQNGDQLAFRKLFDRYATRVASALGRGLSPKEQVADLVQQTFLQVHRARRDFQPSRKFRPWLFTIAFNLRRQYFRTRSRKPAAAMVDNTLISDPTQNTARGAESAMVHAALESLPPEQSEAIVLHHFEALTFREIATITGVSLSAAKVRAHRGYEQLRKILGDDETESLVPAYAKE